MLTMHLVFAMYGTHGNVMDAVHEVGDEKGYSRAFFIIANSADKFYTVEYLHNAKG